MKIKMLYTFMGYTAGQAVEADEELAYLLTESGAGQLIEAPKPEPAPAPEPVKAKTAKK